MSHMHRRSIFVLLIAFLTLAAGSAVSVVEGFEAGFSEGDDPAGPYPYLTITDWENSTAQVIEEDFGFRSYSAGPIEDGCLTDEFGFGWNVDPVRDPVTDHWTFAFADPYLVNSFSIDLLDFGDYFRSGHSGPATATITAYDTAGVVVDANSFTTAGRSGIYDACHSGGEGTQNLSVSSSDFDVAKVVISFDHIDQGIGFDNMAFETGLTTETECADGDYFVTSYAPGPTPPVVTTGTLVGGHLYDVTAYGVFFAGGDGIRADAEYSQDHAQRLAGDPWTDEVNGYEIYGEGLLELLVDGSAVEWGVYSPAHSYTTQHMGSGSPATLSFGIYDIYSSNNVGGLCVGLAFTNRPPVVDAAAADATGDEGDTLSAFGSFVDPDGDALTITADNLVGTFTDAGDGSWSWSFPTDDNYSGTITVTASDAYGGVATDIFDYESLNVAPTIGPLSVTPTGIIPVGTTVTITAPFDDPGTADTHVADWDWGDGDGPVTSPATSSHTYTTPGIYDETVTVTITDDDGGSDTANVEFRVIVWDRAVTGGGQITDYQGTPKKNDDLKVSFGGYIYDVGTDGYYCEWQVNLHNVNADLDGSKFHTNTCTALNTWPPNTSGSPDPEADGVSNFTTYGEFDSAPGYKAIFRMEDFTEPGSMDTFRLELWAPGGEKVYDTFWSTEFGGGSHNVGSARTLLDNGNIQIHVID